MEARIASIFGFRSGRELSDRDGLNEFLSSILAVRLLDDFLDENDLVRIAVCIEATIPFRPVDSVGNTPMERLHHRLVHTNTEYASVLSKQEMIEAVQLAAGLANADNWHFCSKNFKEKSGFLKGSFLLLPEWNANLRDDATCTISDFHQELYKFHTMCIHTDPSRIFSSFNNVPDEETLSDMTEKAKENVSLALRFIRIKLVSVSVLLACALETGGDIPTKAFRTAFTAPPDLPSYSLSSSIDSELHELLACSQDFSFDPISSSLAAGVYKILGNDGTEDIMRSVDSLYPITKETSAALLASCLSSIVDLFVRYLDKADHKRHAELVKLLARFARN